MQPPVDANLAMSDTVRPTLPAEERKRQRLLVVDDQPVNIQAIYQIFSDTYQVLMATSGEQALALCLKSTPDLVLLDVVMPEVDGLETCLRLKQRAETRDIPVIFVTAGVQAEDENVCWEVGGVDFVTKPINPVTLRNRVRVHLKLKQQADFLRNMAFLDGLTGIFNRRYFDEQFYAEWNRSQRSGAQIGVVMLDVDYFKRFNDHYGHQAGDECLRAVAGALKAELNRPADLVARYGGEEFICLLPETGLDGARVVAERLRLAVQRLGLAHAKSDVLSIVTISVGVAATDASKSLNSPLELLYIADRQLYQSKQAGRNRVTS